MSKIAKALVALVAATTVVFAPVAAHAVTPGVGDKTNAVRYGASDPIGTRATALTGLDDEQVTVQAPFPLNFFGDKYEYICFTENGGVFPTNDPASSCGSTYDEDIAALAESAAAPMVAVLATDIDLGECDSTTRWTDDDTDGEVDEGELNDDGFAVPCSLYQGTTTVDGKDAFVVTWYRVSMNDDGNDPTLSNTFQLLLIKRDTGSDAAGWDFDFEFNYATLEDDEDGYAVDEDGNVTEADCTAYENSAKAALYNACRWGIGVGSYTDGVGGVGYEFFEQYNIGQLIDGGSVSMITHSLGSTVPGRYRCSMINGEARGCDFSAALAETGTDANGFGLAGAALIAAGGIALAVRRRKA